MELQLISPTPVQDNNEMILHEGCNEVATKNLSGITIRSEGGLDTIEIDKSFKNSPLGKETKTHVKTSITKDKINNTKQVHIRKIFSCPNTENDRSNYIIRDVYIEHINNKRYKTDQSIKVSLQNNEDLGSYLNLTKEDFLLSMKSN